MRRSPTSHTQFLIHRQMKPAYNKMVLSGTILLLNVQSVGRFCYRDSSNKRDFSGISIYPCSSDAKCNSYKVYPAFLTTINLILIPVLSVPSELQTPFHQSSSRILQKTLQMFLFPASNFLELCYIPPSPSMAPAPQLLPR